MAIKIGTNQSSFTTYENEPEQTRTLSKNENPLTVEDVEAIVLSVLQSAGFTISDDTITVNKSFLVKSELEEDKYLPVLLSDTGTHRIHLLSAFTQALVCRANYGTDTTSDKLVTVTNPS